MLTTLKLADMSISNRTIQKLVIGLSQLIVLEHKNSVKALNAISKKHAPKVSNLTNVYTEKHSNIPIEPLTAAMEHLTNATSVKLYLDRKDDTVAFGIALEHLKHVTEIEIDELQKYRYSILPSVHAYGYQLRILVLREVYDELNMNAIIKECINLEYLHLKVSKQEWKAYKHIKQHSSYGIEPSTIKPLQTKLHTLILNNIIQSDCKSSLFKSLLASPNLKHISLSQVSNFTGPVLVSVQNYKDDFGTLAAFQHLRTLTLVSCDYIKDPILTLIRATTNPLEKISIDDCKGLRREKLAVMELTQFDIALYGNAWADPIPSWASLPSSGGESTSSVTLYDIDTSADDSEQD